MVPLPIAILPPMVVLPYLALLVSTVVVLIAALLSTQSSRWLHTRQTQIYVGKTGQSTRPDPRRLSFSAAGIMSTPDPTLQSLKPCSLLSTTSYNSVHCHSHPPHHRLRQQTQTCSPTLKSLNQSRPPNTNYPRQLPTTTAQRQLLKSSSPKATDYLVAKMD